MNVGELSKLFVIYNQKTGKKEPVVLSPSQQEIFQAIVTRSPKRLHVMTPSQYGKSLVCALAVLLRAMTYPEKWAIVAPSEPKAMIIMRYVIEHIFDSQIFIDQLDVNSSKERLRKEQSKRRITFKRGGEIFVLSADSQNKQAAGETLMGFGAANIILDESCLIDDDIYAKIKRMLGGHHDNFLLEIGNPFNRNHFLRSYRNPNYKVIEIDYKRAISEGRMTEEFINEMRKEAFFDVLYEVKFPPEDAVDSDGWTPLISESELVNSQEVKVESTFGEPRLGIDVARSGGNYNVWILRYSNYARILAKSTSDNIMDVIGITSKFVEEYGLQWNNVFIDATGVGAGVYDRFRERKLPIIGVNLSSSADDDELYSNKRAEIFFRLQKWIKQGGRLEKNKDFFQLADIKYKTRSSGKIKIIDKDALRKKGIPSPDVADALSLTFARSEDKLYYMERQRAIKNQSLQPKFS